MRTSTKISRAAALLALALTTTSRAGAAETPPSTFDQLLDRELAQGQGLTADDAARETGRTSPNLRARSAELEAAAADVDRATLAYIPVVTVSGRYARLSDIGGATLGNIVAAPPGAPTAPTPLPAGTPLFSVPLKFETPLDQYVFQANLLVPVSDYFLRIAPNRDVAARSEDAAKKNVDVVRRRTAADARIAYYAWVNARLRVVVSEQALAQAQAHERDVKAMLAAGTAPQADVLRVESLVAKSELMLASSKALANLTEEQLRTGMHAAREHAFHIGEDIRVEPRGTPHAPLGELVKRALAARPELAALDAAQAARERAIDVDRAAYVPRLDLFADAQYSNPNPRVFPTKAEFRGSWDAGAQLTWNLSDLPGATARVRGDEARYQARALERAGLEDQIRLEVTQAYEDSEVARVAESTTAHGLAAAEESYRARNLLFQNGRATTVEMVDSETDLTSARLEALKARIDARAADVRLAYALGRSDLLDARSAPHQIRR